MDKPVTTATKAAAAPEAPPTAAAPARMAATEVATSAPAPDVERVKAEKALRLAKALRDNLRRRKVSTRAARPSN